MSEQNSDSKASKSPSPGLPMEAVFLVHVAENKPLVVNFPSGPKTFSVAEMRSMLSPESLRALES